MNKVGRLVLLLLFMSFISAPVFSQEEEMPAEAATDVAPAELPEEGVVTGTVSSVDAANETVAVKTDDGAEKTFKVVDGETILWKGIEDIEIGNVAAGDPVEVGYYANETGELIASWVDVIVAEDTTAAEGEEEAAPITEDEE